MVKFKSAASASSGELVTIAKYCLDSGRTDPAIRGLIQTGKLLIGKHYHRKGRRISLEKKMVDAYFRGE